jgi:hypothetical protein
MSNIARYMNHWKQETYIVQYNCSRKEYDESLQGLLLLEQVIALGNGIHKIRLEPSVNEILKLLHFLLSQTRLQRGHRHVPAGFLWDSCPQPTLAYQQQVINITIPELKKHGQKIRLWLEVFIQPFGVELTAISNQARN